jgi:hypothetical protein
MNAYDEDRLTAARMVHKLLKWSLDPHEEQNPEHKAALLRLLPIQHV